LVCFVNQTHAVLYSYCSLITKQITLMSRLFLANQTHTSATREVQFLNTCL